MAEVAGHLAGVGSLEAHAASLLKTGLNKLTAIKTMLHGLSRGIISRLQGGSFKEGLLSGLSSAFDVGSKGYGGFVGRTVIMAVVGGTASAIGGGKFANGAVSAAFVHMFNAEAKAFLMKSSKYYNAARIAAGRKYFSHDATMERGRAIYHTMQNYSKPMMAAGLTGIGVLTGTEVLYPFVMANPVGTYNFATAAMDGGYSANALGVATWSGRIGQAIETGIKWLMN